MENNAERDFILRNVNFLVFIFLLSILSMVNAVLLLTVQLPEADRLILIINTAISAILMVDFIYALIKSRASRDYLIGWYGWMAFVGSLPVPGIAIFRVIQSILISRKLRGSELSDATKLALRQRGRSTFLTTLVLATLALELAGILILRAEHGTADAEIRTASDALWWGYVTMSTVGYGDLVPVTTNGRVIGLITMTVGVVLFSVTTGFLTDWFRQGRGDSGQAFASDSELVVDDPRLQHLEINRMIDEQDQAHRANMAELRARLSELEKYIEH